MGNGFCPATAVIGRDTWAKIVAVSYSIKENGAVSSHTCGLKRVRTKENGAVSSHTCGLKRVRFRCTRPQVEVERTYITFNRIPWSHNYLLVATFVFSFSRILAWHENQHLQKFAQKSDHIKHRNPCSRIPVNHPIFHHQNSIPVFKQ